MKKLLIIVSLVLIQFIPLHAADTQKQKFYFNKPSVAKNVLYAELTYGLIQAGINFNYERLLANNLTIRMGFGFASNYFEGNVRGIILMLMHCAGSGNNFFEFGWGISLAQMEKRPYDFDNYPLHFQISDKSRDSWVIMPAFSIGYRYQSQGEGMIYRFVLTYEFLYGTGLGFSIGQTF